MDQLDSQYATLSEAVEKLKAQGYTDELTVTGDRLFNNASPLDPAVFQIDSFHRFEGPSDPADMSIVYAISSESLGLKGLLVGDYGGDARSAIHRMVQPLSAHDHEGRVQPVQAVEPGENVKA
jgi:hypothetical protein